MKVFCPVCFSECMETNGRSRCCDAPAFVACNRCLKRLFRLDHVVVRELDRPVLCYWCWRKAREAAAKVGVPLPPLLA